jgi:hypothetical protein
MNMRNLLPEPEQVLVKCPQCGAWPMSLAPHESAAALYNRLAFKCPKCQTREVHTVSVGGRSVRAAPRSH